MAESLESSKSFIRAITRLLEQAIPKIQNHQTDKELTDIMNRVEAALSGLAAAPLQTSAASTADQYLASCLKALTLSMGEFGRALKDDQKEQALALYEAVIQPEFTKLNNLFAAATAGNAVEKLRQQYPERNSPDGKVQMDAFTYGYPEVRSWGEGTVLTIGKFCSIADKVAVFLGGEHRSDWVTTYPFSALSDEFSSIQGHPKSKGDVVIGNDVWIASGATILSGVRIGDGAIIGAQAVVGKDVPPYAIVAGNPAAVIKFRFEQPIIDRLLQIKWWDWELEDIKRAVPLLLSTDIAEFISYANKKTL